MRSQTVFTTEIVLISQAQNPQAQGLLITPIFIKHSLENVKKSFIMSLVGNNAGS